MKKIVTVVGARPQFVKAAVISRLIKSEYADEFEEILVHTGQHYDENMSDIFFSEMDIPRPDVNLHVGSGSHGAMTGRMLEKIEGVLLTEKPDLLLVYGDTNSTFAGAFAASKLHIPVAHVEAGLRSFNMAMPEEQNRILTDRISNLLFCPTQSAVDNLAHEGLREGVYRTGDIMLDASLYYRKTLSMENDMVPAESFVLMTLHRAENTDDPRRLKGIVDAVNALESHRFVLPLHPRTKKYLEAASLSFADHVKLIDPVGFGGMLALESACDFILTDSGGVQKEAFFFRKPCITLRDQTEWVETVEAGWNVLVGAETQTILDAVQALATPAEWPTLYGSGRTGQEILDTISKKL